MHGTRLTGATRGPISYRDIYGGDNPWVRWLIEHGAILLRFTPVEMWEGPNVREMTRGEQDELRQLRKVSLL